MINPTFCRYQLYAGPSGRHVPFQKSRVRTAPATFNQSDRSTGTTNVSSPLRSKAATMAFSVPPSSGLVSFLRQHANTPGQETRNESNESLRSGHITSSIKFRCAAVGYLDESGMNARLCDVDNMRGTGSFPHALGCAVMCNVRNEATYRGTSHSKGTPCCEPRGPARIVDNENTRWRIGRWNGTRKRVGTS